MVVKECDVMPKGKAEEKEVTKIVYDKSKENELPCIVIDTNIWGRITQAQMEDLKQLNDHYGFKYFFSSINCIETFVRLDTHFKQQKKALQNMSIYAARIFYYQKRCFSER
jgi:hypothetical protein